MNRFDVLKWPVAAALLCMATMAGAERSGARLVPVLERRAEPVSAPARPDGNGGNAASAVDDAQSDPKRPDWMMLLAGLAVAGWIAQRRLASPLE